MLTVKEVHPCPTSWHQQFLNTLFNDIKGNYGYISHVISSHKEMTLLKACFHHTVYEYPRRFLDMYGIIDSTPYYYIKYILDTNPVSILDIGCGDNVFKKSFPNLIIGMDNDLSNCMHKPDIHAEFNTKFSYDHAESYSGVISINAIHFSPVYTITERLLDVARLLLPGHRAFVSFNIETWLMVTPAQTIKSLFGSVPKWDDVLNYFNDKILDSKLNFLVSDWPILHISDYSTIRDDYNGNIRLVFSK